jgi:hypothetical protein
MKIVYKIQLVLALTILTTVDLFAQCPMCKTALGSARDNGSDVGATLNNGIMYLLVLPYTIAMIFGIIYYNKWRKKRIANHNG